MTDRDAPKYAPHWNSQLTTLALVAIAASASLWAFVAQQRSGAPQGLRQVVKGDPPGKSQLVTELRIKPEPDGLDRVVRWRGFWWLPEDRRVELHVRTSGKVVVEIDGRSILARRDGSDSIPPTIEMTAGLHPLHITARLPADGEMSFRIAEPDRAPVDVPSGQLFPRRYPRRRLEQIARTHELDRLARTAWRGLFAWLILWAALCSRQTLGRILRRPGSAWWTGVGALVLYLAFLIVWFRDPGIPGTNALRAWSPVPIGVLSVLAAGLWLWVNRARVSRFFAEACTALAMRPRDQVGLAVALVLALLVQAPLLAWPVGAMDSDSAVSALAGKHIAEGRVAPAFYYGSLKTGTLSSHLVAARTVVFGASTRSLMEVTRLLYLGFLVLLYVLMMRGFGTAVALASTAWLAATPYPLAINTTYSEYPELLFLGTGALLVACLIADRSVHSRGWGLLLGALLGLGLWSHPLSAPFTLAVCATGAVMLPLRRLKATAGLALLGLALGIAPAIVGVGRRLPELVGYLATAGREVSPPFAESLLSSVSGVFTTTFPTLLIGYRNLPSLGVLPVVALSGIVLGSVALALVVGLRGARMGANANNSRTAIALVLSAFFIVHLATFWLSPFRLLTFPPRYLVPLYLAVIPLLVAGASMGLRRLCRPRVASIVLAILVAAAAIPGAASTLRWYGEVRAVDVAIRSGIASFSRAGIDHCVAPYWDAFRVSHATLEAILCQADDVPRVPFYDRMLRQRQSGRFAPFVYDINRRWLGDLWRRRLEDDGIRYQTIETPYLLAIVADPSPEPALEH